VRLVQVVEREVLGVLDPAARQAQLVGLVRQVEQERQEATEVLEGLAPLAREGQSVCRALLAALAARDALVARDLQDRLADPDQQERQEDLVVRELQVAGDQAD